MKNTLRVLSTFVVFIVLSSFSFVQEFNAIENAIRTGNASALSANFEANVEITIKNTGNSYSKSQAEMVLKNFFATNVPKSFTVAHTGNSPDGSKYFIGNLATSTGNYRTYVLTKKGGNGAMVIQEIRFEVQ